MNLPQEFIERLARRAEEAIYAGRESRARGENPEPALAELDQVIAAFEAVQSYFEEQETEYLSFANPLEMNIYYFLYQPQGVEVCPLPIPAAALYLEKALLLRQTARLPEVRKALMTARRWNPVSPHIALDYAELMMRLGELDECVRLIREAYPLIYSGNCLARFYNGFAAWFKHREMWEEAVACYFKSLQFNPDGENEAAVVGGLTEIQNVHGIDFKTPSVKQLDACMQENGLPVRGNEATAEELFNMGKTVHRDDPASKLAYAACVAAWEISHEKEVREFIDTCWPAEKKPVQQELPVYRV